MNTILTAALIAACLCAAVLLGIFVRRILPDHYTLTTVLFLFTLTDSGDRARAPVLTIPAN